MEATRSAGTGTMARERPAAAQVHRATKLYGDLATGVRALDDVTLAIPAGRWTAIMGPSGSGKSTLLHCMAGLDSLTSGQAVLGDQDLGGLSDDKLAVVRRRRIGFVFQVSTWSRRSPPGRT